LIPNGLAIAGRCSRPALINIRRAVGLRKTIVALRRGGPNNDAKHFEIDHVGNDVAAAAGFY